MCRRVGSHAPSCGRQLLGLPGRMEYLSPQGVLLPRVCGKTASPLWSKFRGPAAWQATPSWAVCPPVISCYHGSGRCFPWSPMRPGRAQTAALEYRSCHWPGGPAGSPQCVRPWGCRPWCPVPLLPSMHVGVRRPGSRGACSPVCSLCAVRVSCWFLCPSSSPPHFLFCFFFALYLFCFVVPVFFSYLEKRPAHTAGTGTGNWRSGAIVLCPLVCVVGALVAAAPTGCSSRVLMYTGTAQGVFG